MAYDKTSIADLIKRNRSLAAEYGPVEIMATFMFDGHYFGKVSGTPDEMGAQIFKYMVEDKYCGCVFVRIGGQQIDALSFHGDYNDRDKTNARIVQWVADMRQLVVR